MSTALAPAAAPLGAWLRLAALVAALMACILVPFALWGEALDTAAPAWLGSVDRAAAVAVLGIVLLVADVLLPIPSSVVGMALCWTLGPLWGGLSFFTGLLTAFAFGYGLGRLMPEQRLRAWIGPALWDAVSARAHRRALWWIALARPLPLLAEMSALLAGVWRVPPLAALGSAALSSAAIAVLYAASAWLGRQGPGPLATVLATFTLPALAWGVHRAIVRRLHRDATPPAATEAAACAASPRSTDSAS